MHTSQYPFLDRLEDNRVAHRLSHIERQTQLFNLLIARVKSVINDIDLCKSDINPNVADMAQRASDHIDSVLGDENPCELYVSDHVLAYQMQYAFEQVQDRIYSGGTCPSCGAQWDGVTMDHVTTQAGEPACEYILIADAFGLYDVRSDQVAVELEQSEAGDAAQEDADYAYSVRSSEPEPCKYCGEEMDLHPVVAYDREVVTYACPVEIDGDQVHEMSFEDAMKRGEQ